MNLETLLYLSLACNVFQALLCARFFAGMTSYREDSERLRAILHATRDGHNAKPALPAERWFTDYRRSSIHRNDKRDL